MAPLAAHQLDQVLDVVEARGGAEVESEDAQRRRPLGVGQLLLEAEDWLRVARYRRIDGEGGPWNRFALHELRSLEAMDSPQRRRAREAPLRAAMAERPWFGSSGRWIYEVIARTER